MGSQVPLDATMTVAMTSPNILLGILALVLTFVLYLVSATSMGRLSISHALFSGLLCITPTEESLKKESPTNSEAARSSQRNNNDRRSNLSASSSIRDLSQLSFTCKSIRPGSVPLSLMTEKNQIAFQQWQALDALVCFGVACFLALVGPRVFAFYKVFQQDIVCCDDLNCWRNWWREQMGGAGWIFTPTGKPPENSMLVLLSAVSTWFWWRLVMHSTSLPQGSTFRFSPFSYINAWIMAFATLFILNLSSNMTIESSRDSNLATSVFGIPLNDALEEWTVRVTLWIGLTGFFKPDDEFAQQRVLNAILQMAHLLLVAATSLLGFCVADPLRETMRLYWSAFCGDEVDLVHEQHMSRLIQLLRRHRGQNTLISMALLPILCWVTYLVPAASFQHMGASPQVIRSAFAWLFLGSMTSVIKPLLQKYLLQSVSAAGNLLETSRKPAAEEVLFPFENRNRSLVATGSQLVIFPFIVLLVLSLGHVAGSPPINIYNNSSLSTGIYPFAYHQSIWNEQDMIIFEKWEEFQARAFAQSTLDHSTSSSLKASLARANIGLCPQNKSTLSFLTFDDPSDKRSRRRLDQDYPSPIYRMTSASQLLAHKMMVRTHFVHVLRRLQKLVKGASSEDTGTSQVKKDWQTAWHDLDVYARALSFHPVFTSTIVLPILDFMGLVLCTLWVLYFTWYGFSSWPARRHRRRYVLHVREGTCQVVSSSNA